MKTLFRFSGVGFGNTFSNYEFCGKDHPRVYFKEIVDTQSLAILSDTELAKWSIEYFDDRGKPKVIPLEDIAGTLYLSVQINDQLSCMLHKPMETILNRAVSVGLMEKWNNDEVFKQKMAEAKLHTEQHILAFSLSHLQGAFYIIAIGLMMSIFVFIIEILVQAFVIKFP